MGKLHYTTDEFIEKAKFIFGEDCFDFLSTLYTGSKNNIIIICKIHGPFNTTPNRFMESEHGCQECSGVKKLTTEIFIKRSNEIHNYYYSYVPTRYKSCDKKVDIICPVHGKFSQIAKDHMDGHGCDKCGGTAKITLKEFIERGIENFGNKFDYSKIPSIKNLHDKAIIGCPIHGNIIQSIVSHYNGFDCRKCTDEAKKISIDEFIKRANLIHYFEYCYDLSKYDGTDINIEIICFKHGSFFQTPRSHLAGNGCKHCSNYISKGETSWLNYMNVPIEFRQLTIYANNKKYNTDALDINTNTVYEYNGDYWHGNPDVFDPNKINRNNKKTFGQLYQDTINRENELRALGYNLVVIWENDWKKIEKSLKLDNFI